MKKKDAWVLATCFLLAALLFRGVATTLAVGLLAWIAFQIIRRRNWKVLACVVSCTVSLVLFEAIGAMYMRSVFSKTFYVDADHRLIPNTAKGINSDGVRCPVEASDFRDETFNVIFLGDSFTFGYNCDSPDDAFPSQLEALVRERRGTDRFRVVNFSWPSSSPGPSFRLLRDVGHKYRPDLVILCLDMTDFHDDLRSAADLPAYEDSPTLYLLARAGLADVVFELRRDFRFDSLWRRRRAGDRPLPIHRLFVTDQPLGASLEDMQETERNIRLIAEHCEERLNADFMLVMLPRNYQYSDRESPESYIRVLYDVGGPFVREPFRWLKAFKSRAEFPCYSLLTDFESCGVFPTCFHDDPHWNRAGHTVAAEAIYRILEGEGYWSRLTEGGG